MLTLEYLGTLSYIILNPLCCLSPLIDCLIHLRPLLHPTMAHKFKMICYVLLYLQADPETDDPSPLLYHTC